MPGNDDRRPRAEGGAIVKQAGEAAHSVGPATDNLPPATPLLPAPRQHPRDPVALAEALAELADDLLGRDHCWRAGFEVGHALGVVEGRRIADDEAAKDFARLAAAVRRMASVPTTAEIQELRRLDDKPCTRRCSRCSTCVRAAWLARHGRDHAGVGR